MLNKYKRGLSNGFVQLLQNGRVFEVPVSRIFQKLSVQELVRIPKSEYPDGALIGETFIHFGLPVHDGNPTEFAVLPRIIKNGYFRKNGEEQLPILSFDNVWIAKKTQNIESISYNLLTNKYFKNAIGGCSDESELKKLILSRYRKTLPDLTDEELLSQGVSVRRIKLLKRITFSY